MQLPAPLLGTIPLSATEKATETNVCTLEALAPILEHLLHREVQPAELRQRAVGLGLLRLQENGAPSELTPKTASRLLLAAYRLPAQVQRGTVSHLCSFLAAGLDVLVMTPSWSHHGGLMVVAARTWDDLPTSAGAFFGGQRDRNGSFHWDMAQCDTDATGQILRSYCPAVAEE